MPRYFVDCNLSLVESYIVEADSESEAERIAIRMFEEDFNSGPDYCEIEELED